VSIVLPMCRVCDPPYNLEGLFWERAVFYLQKFYTETSCSNLSDNEKKPMTRGANLLPPFQASFTCFNIYFYEYTLYQLSCFSNHYTGRQRIGVSGGKPRYCAKTDRLWDFWAAFSQASYWFQIHDQCCNEKQKKVGRCRGKGVVMHFCAEGERNCCFFRKFPIYWHCLEVFTGLIWA